MSDTTHWIDRCHFGDVRVVLRQMVDDGVKVNAIVTSPPYWLLRSYLPDEHPDKHLEIGAEPTISEFIRNLVGVFELCRQVLRDDGVMFLNIGDSYAGSRGGGAPSASSTLMGNGHIGGGPKLQSMTQSRRRDDASIPRSDRRIKGLKPKDLVGQPWRLAFGLQGMTVLPSLTLIEWADGLQHARVAQDWTLVQAIERRIRAEAMIEQIGKAWYLRQDIIWKKLSPMPESAKDRCTKAHEYIFLLAKSESYHFDANAISEPAKAGRTPGNKNAPKGQAAYEAGVEEHRTKAGLLTYSQKVQGSAGIQRSNKRSVWDIASEPYAGAHYAPFPRKLVEPCILAGCPAGGVVLDPFFGSGTTGEVAQNLGRHFIGIDLDRRNDPLQAMRLQQPGLILETV